MNQLLLARQQRGWQLAQQVVEECRGRGVTIATAESLTAGLCAATVAQIPGASAVLRGGVVAYATDLKTELAGVDKSLLEEKGAVHPEVAAQLAAGAAQRCGSDIGIGLTGVAGPEPQAGRAVGEGYVGVRYRGVDTVERMPELADAEGLAPELIRALIRQSAVNLALSLTLSRLAAYDGGNK